MAAICDSLSPCFLSGKNKRVGKQLASQKILQLLHPHVKNWGSLLRMYGRESSKMVKQVMGPPAGTGGQGQSQALAARGGDGVRAGARGRASRPHTALLGQLTQLSTARVCHLFCFCSLGQDLKILANTLRFSCLGWREVQGSEVYVL